MGIADSRKNRDTAWMKHLRCVEPSQDRQEERRYKGKHFHTCQRGSPLRDKVHFGSNQRFFHVKTVSTEQGRHNCNGPCIH